MLTQKMAEMESVTKRLTPSGKILFKFEKTVLSVFVTENLFILRKSIKIAAVPKYNQKKKAMLRNKMHSVMVDIHDHIGM